MLNHKNCRHYAFFGRCIPQSGQALLIVILVMVVALTIGLSVAVRSTSNLRVSNEEESSERAFTAAEAGIEQSSLTSSSVSMTNLPNNTSYTTNVTSISGAGFNLNNGTVILKDEPVDIWLSTYPTYATPWTGTLSISWGNASDTCGQSETSNTRAAIEVILISGSIAAPKITTYLLDSCATRASNNNAEVVSGAGDTIDGVTYPIKKSISVSSGLIARVVPLYASTIIGVRNNGSDPVLPSQGSVITATGIANESQRKIISFKGYPKLPVELFPFLIFSPK